jgi:hypothetical protein
LKPSSVTLPRSGMIVNGTLYLRPSLEHHTLENGSGCWLGTPTAGTGTKGRSAEWRKGKKPNPQEAAMMWRTPSQSDGEGGVMRMGEGDGKYKLRDQVQEVNRQFWPTPTARDKRTFKGAQRPPKSQGSEPLTVQVGGQLNPQWVEWLMGFPAGWTDLKCLGMRGFRRWLEGF